MEDVEIVVVDARARLTDTPEIHRHLSQAGAVYPEPQRMPASAFNPFALLKRREKLSPVRRR